jgi:Rieske Fe-S protein
MEIRSILLIVTSLTAAIGIAIVNYVFIVSLYPSETVKNERILRVDIQSIPLDGYRLFKWRKKLVLVFRPGKQSVDYLIKTNPIANGMDFDESSIPKIFAYERISTYKGCALYDASNNEYFRSKYQGWYDPCHMGFWDFSGRYLPGVNAPNDTSLPNLKPVNEYRWVSNTEVEFRP